MPPHNPQKIKEEDKKLKKTKTTEEERHSSVGVPIYNPPKKSKERRKDIKDHRRNYSIPQYIATLSF